MNIKKIAEQSIKNESDYRSMGTKKARAHLLSIPLYDFFMHELRTVYSVYPIIRLCPKAMSRARKQV